MEQNYNNLGAKGLVGMNTKLAAESLTSLQINKINHIVSCIYDKLETVLCQPLLRAEEAGLTETKLAGDLENIINRLTDIQDRIRL